MRWIFGYVLLLLTSCVFEAKPFNPEDYRKNPKLVCDRMMRSVDKRFDKAMQKRGISIIGSGGGRTDGIERVIGYSFKTPQALTIESGRELLVSIVTTYLDILNNQKGIEECLVEYPFIPDRLNIVIYTGQEEYSSLLGISCWSGDVGYFIRDPDDEYKHTDIYNETFEEAKAIVDQEHALHGPDFK